MDVRYEQGLENLKKIDGEAGERVIAALADIASDVGSYIIRFAFGEIYQRPQLDLKAREMITLASLLTQGDTSPQLEVHINGGLNTGLTQAEIIEIFIQCIPYTGFPRVLNAVSTAKKVFSERV